jgi:ABC-type glutathione transport system ATPase component
VTVLTDVLVQAVGVSRTFGHGRTAHPALHPTDLSVGPGTSLGVVGESGSGKSTLSRLLVGLDTPTSGRVEFEGRNVAELLSTQGGRADFRRAVQFVGQDTTSTFDPLRTLRDAVLQPVLRLTEHRGATANRLVDETLERLGLDPALADRRPAQVSGGQRQRFSLARGLVVQPRVLVCDEVVSALDVSVQGRILNLVKDLCAEQGTGLVFVSHGLPATAFVARDLVVMQSGRVVERGTSEQLLSAPEHPYTQSLLAAYSRGRRVQEAS